MSLDSEMRICLIVPTSLLLRHNIVVSFQLRYLVVFYKVKQFDIDLSSEEVLVEKFLSPAV